MKNILICLILLTPAFILAETFRGFVYDENRTPLEEVLIIHGENSTFSQENGYFMLSSQAEADSLIIYYAFHKIIKVNTAEFTSTKHFTLIPLNIELSSFTFTSKKSNNQLPSSQEKTTISIKDKATESNNLAEVLTQDSSIKIEGTQLPGERQTASILGHSSRHTLVMLDGIPLNSSGEDFDLASIPVELVEEVEIYKNNVSSLSGGGGIAGVINIKTKKSSKSNNEFSLNANYGSYDFKKVTLTSGFNWSNTTFYAVFSQQSSDNNFKYKIKKGNTWHTQTRENNSKESSKAMLNISSKFTLFDIYYSGNLTLYDNQLPGPTNFLDLYNGAKIEGHDFYNDIKIKKKLANINNSLEFYLINKESEYSNLSPNITINRARNISQNSRLGIKLSNIFEHDKLQISLINSMLEESYSFESKFKLNSDIDKTSQYSYASNIINQYHDSYGLVDYNVIASLRYDNHNRFNDFTTYRLSGDFSYDSLIKPTLLFSYGNGFTVPSFYSLYWKGDSHAIGNPDLLPEESRGYQLGLKLEYSTFTLKFNRSFNEIDNLIQWIEVQLQGGIWKPVNIGSSEIANYELESNWEILPKLNLFSKTIISDTKNKTLTQAGSPSGYYGKELVYIPEYIINIGMNYSYSSYKIKLDYTKTGKQWTTQDNLKTPLADYKLLNASLGKTFQSASFEHNLSINLNNLLNNYYEIVSYNPQAPFNWSVGYGIKYTFK